MKPSTPSVPHAIIMIGIPGAGKTFFTENFSKNFLVPQVNYASIREAAHSKKAADSLMVSVLTELFKTKRTLIIDSETGTKRQRSALAAMVTKAGYLPLFIWVQTATPDAERRSLKAGLDREAFHKAVAAFEAPDAKEGVLVISGKHTLSSQLRVVLKYLSEQKGGADVLASGRQRQPRSIIMR